MPTVSGTVTDSDAIPWANGSITFNLVGGSGSYNCSGTPMQPSDLTKTFALDSSGNFSGSLCANANITPANTQWAITVASATSAPPQAIAPTILSGSTQNLTSYINGLIKAIRLAAVFGARAYSDVEISNPIAGSSYFNLTSSVTRVFNGTSWSSSGGGSSLPTATSAGQIYASTGAGTTAGVQGQIFYSQPGDTIASIEAQATSLCTYVVTIPQTFTLAANHTLSSNIQLDFRAGGSWTVNGAFTLTIPGNITATINQHFAGTSTIAFGLLQQFANVEWFGAVGDGTTDDHVAIQNTLNALIAGQAVLQAKTYNIATSTLSITKSNVGILGQNLAVTNTTQYANPSASTIISSSASADIIDAWGSSLSVNIFGNKFQNFNLARSVVPNTLVTGPPATGPAGFSLKYSYGAILDRIVSQDSGFGFFFHAIGSQGVGYINNCAAIWGYNGVTETTGAYTGFWFDSANGEASPSVRMTNNFAAPNNFNPNNVNTLGLVLAGAAFNDFMGWNFETSGINYGTFVEEDGSATSIGAQDIHFRNFILDTCRTAGFYITGATSAMTSTIEIDGGWIEVQGSGQTSAAIFILGSNNIVVRGVQIVGSGFMNYAASVSTSNNIAFIGNNIRTATTGLLFTGGSNYTVSSNLLKASTTGVTLLSLVSSPSHVSIGDNTFSGSASIGVSVAAGTSDVHGLETNNFDSAITTAISSAIPFLIPPIGSETVTFSATPTFSNLTRSSIITLTANITSFTLAAGVDGQGKTLIFCQNGTGSFTVAGPANVRGLFTVSPTANKCSSQHFTYSAVQTAWMADSPGALGN